MRNGRPLLTLSLLVLSNVTLAQEPANRAEDEAAIRRVVQAFIETREDDAADALRALLTEDVDQQITSGRMRSGREAVIDGSLETTRSAGGTRTITIESIRFLGRDAAIVDGPYDIVGRSDGPDRHYRTAMVLRRDDGGWKIAAIRNMQPVQ